MADTLFYDTNYECLYGYLMDDAAFTNETDEEKEHIRRYTYQRDLLGIFGFIHDADVSKVIEQKIDQQISLLYVKAKDDPYIKEAIASLKLQFTSATDNDEVFFIILFSYDLLFLSQRCFSELILSYAISEQNGSDLIEYIKSNALLS